MELVEKDIEGNELESEAKEKQRAGSVQGLKFTARESTRVLKKLVEMHTMTNSYKNKQANKKNPFYQNKHPLILFP